MYSLPTGYLAVIGENIIPSQHNPPLEDIASALTGSLPRSGSAAMVGPLELADGSVATPGVSFASDPTTGLYKTASGIGIAVAGTKVAEFGAAGLTATIPIGGVVDFAGPAPPAGWLFCLGQSVLRASYPALFATIGTAFGSVDSTHFTIPDTQGRVIAGVDNGSGRLDATSGMTGTGIGSVGGGQTVTLTTPQIPSHNHPVFLNDPGHAHTTDAEKRNGAISDVTPGSVLGTGAAATVSPNTTGITVRDTTGGGGAANQTAVAGGGGAHINVQPTITMFKIIYAGV